MTTVNTIRLTFLGILLACAQCPPVHAAADTARAKASAPAATDPVKLAWDRVGIVAQWS